MLFIFFTIFFRALCILFLPFRDEMKDIHSKDVKKMYDNNRDEIEKNREKYEKHRTILEVVEESEKDKEDDADDLEEFESPYIDEETTLEEEIDDFEKKIKAEAQKVLNNFSSSMDLMEGDSHS